MILSCSSTFCGFHGDGEVTRTALSTIFLALALSTPVCAQDNSKDTSINDLKAKIFDAKTVQQRFTSGLRHCSELNGTNFYFQPRDRVLDLEEYHRSLENFVSEGMYNAETRRPWTKQDADARWAQVMVQARADQANRALVSSLPFLQKNSTKCNTRQPNSKPPRRRPLRLPSEEAGLPSRDFGFRPRVAAIAHNRQAPRFAAC
jgi:hypothetical protein